MIRWREGIVDAVRPGWPGVSVVEVSIAGAASPPLDRTQAVRRPDARSAVRALAYTDVVGTPQVGDRVLLNTTALDRGLGTGGYAVVTAVPDRPAAWPAGWEMEPERPGHLVKARYTPLQTMVLGVDDPESGHHALLESADDLAGMPVVAADLHSSLPAVLAGVRHVEPSARVAYVMSDGGALPIAFSRTVDGMKGAGWLVATITAGQAYGGDLEAVTVHTALLAARHVVGADLAVVIQGPGNLGTGTRWGFSGVAAGEALNAAAVLGGRPVAALRVSQADERPRHRGLSHHSATAYGRVLAHPADLVLPLPSRPSDSPGHPSRPDRSSAQPGLAECLVRVRAQVEELVTRAPHLRPVEVATDGLLEALRHTPVRLSTMGRNLDDDPAAFVAAAAAGAHAALLLDR